MLSDQMFLILVSLAERERHGYEMIRRAGELSDGRVRLATGSLYPALERLLQLGLIARFDRTDEDAPNRRYYQLTGAGAEKLEAEAQARSQEAKVGFAALAARGGFA